MPRKLDKWMSIGSHWSGQEYSLLKLVKVLSGRPDSVFNGFSTIEAVFELFLEIYRISQFGRVERMQIAQTLEFSLFSLELSLKVRLCYFRVVQLCLSNVQLPLEITELLLVLPKGRITIRKQPPSCRSGDVQGGIPKVPLHGLGRCIFADKCLDLRIVTLQTNDP